MKIKATICGLLEVEEIIKFLKKYEICRITNISITSTFGGSENFSGTRFEITTNSPLNLIHGFCKWFLTTDSRYPTKNGVLMSFSVIDKDLELEKVYRSLANIK